jgi:endoglycosylceramidase
VPKFSDDPNLVFAPHLYAESIGPSFPGLLDLLATLLPVLGTYYGTPVWVGEYGAFGSARFNRNWMERFARLHDANGYDGGTWWQWEQECGDPHSIEYPRDADWVATRLSDCDGSRMEVACPSRSYPRAVPGRMTSLTAAPCGGTMVVMGTTPTRSTADLWFEPVGDADGAPPDVSGHGIVAVDPRRVGGGWRLFVTVEGDYRISVAGS